jgi:hypothetical protein
MSPFAVVSQTCRFARLASPTPASSAWSSSGISHPLSISGRSVENCAATLSGRPDVSAGGGQAST